MNKKLLSAASTVALVALSVSTEAHADVTLGVAGPMTGGNAAFGDQLLNGVKVAVEQVNADGGLLGEQIRLQVGDDQGDAKQGVNVANYFAGDGVKFVIGHMFSGITMAASEVYAENGMLMITPAASNPGVTDKKLWNVFRTCGRDDQQGAIAGKVLATRFAGKNLAIVHDKTAYGQGLAEATAKAANTLGLKEALVEGLTVGDKDYSALITKLKSNNVDVVYYGGLYTESGLLIRQAREQGLQAQFMSGDGMMSSEFWAIAGTAADGALMTFHPDPRERPEAKKALAAFEAAKINPESYTLYAYAAVEVLSQAVKKANSLDPEAIAKVMHSGISFDTVIGPITYDEKGDPTRDDYALFQWRAGSYSQLPPNN